MENTKEKEIWRDVKGYEGYYQASNMGRVRSLDRWVTYSDGRECFFRGRILYGSFNNGGYRKITLSINGKSRSFTASQIVAMTYLDYKPNGVTLVVDHVNGVKTDDRVENLRIVTHRANTSTCFRKDRKTLSSKYVGVSWDKSNSKWRADIRYEGELIYLGCYDDELEASKAYQDALARIEDGTFNVNDYKPNFTSKFKGVTFHKKSNKWQSRVRVNGNQKHLGLYPTEIEASKAYQDALVRIEGGTFNCVQKFKQEVKKH